MKILVSEEIADNAVGLLEGHEVSKTSYDSQDFVKELRSAEVLVVRTYTKVDKDLLKLAPNLRYVIRCGVGLENIDTKACESDNIKVLNAPGSNAESVAEHVVMFILASKRNLVNLDNHVRKGKWKPEHLGTELMGKTIGLIGFGNIGKKVAERLQGFGVKIISYEIYKDHDTAKRLGVEFVELDELIEESDAISIHVPLMKETFHMINQNSIERMKQGVIMINTARGAIIDEDALVNALESGKVSFAALDVFKDEPMDNEKLRRMENVILTPHIAGVTKESFERMCTQPIEQFLKEAVE